MERFDVLIRNAHVLVGPDLEERAGYSVGIRDGTIALLDPTAAVEGLEPCASEEIDGSGCVVLPAFANTHTHLAMTMFRGLAANRTLEEFIDHLTTAEQENLTPETLARAVRAAADEMVTSGTTVALDMYPFDAAVRAAGRARGLHVVNGPTFANFPSPDRRTFDAWLADTRAWMASEPAAHPFVMPHSTYGLDRGQLMAIGALVRDFDAAVHVHASESLAEVATVAERFRATPIQVLEQAGLLGHRTVVAHAVHLTDADIALLADRKATVAHCPWSNLRLGCGIAPITQLLAAGVHVALGTDGAVSSDALDLWSAVRLVANLHKGVTRDPSAVSALTALRMATVNGTRAVGIQDAGEIRTGARADVQVLDLDRPHFFGYGDLLTAIVHSARPADVRHVVADGRLVVRDGVTITNCDND